MKRLIPFFLLFVVVLFLFKPFFVERKLPIPSDTIVGLYHPFRDFYEHIYPRGVPFKNFLITDPVRQQIPWRELGIELLKKGQLPLWNPYSFSGTPLLANVQSAPFYPLNILFSFLPSPYAWSILVFSQPFLAGLFLYLYLRQIRIERLSSAFGAIAFSLSGFSVAWLEWNTLVHTILWLPFILFAIEKIFLYFKTQENAKLSFGRLRPFEVLRRFQVFDSEGAQTRGALEEMLSNAEVLLKIKKYEIWMLILLFGLISSFFAGHLQIFLYTALIVFSYIVVRWVQFGFNKRILSLFIVCALSFVVLSAIFWIPILQYIFQSGRGLDQIDWQIPGWFIPWQHLLQFVAPDFFGNPTTLNYWGVWNYGEFVGYIGIAPLIMALYAMFYRRDKKTFYFGSIFFLSLIFSLPTIFAKIPFFLNIPFFSTSQPTRLLAVTDFSLSVLAALGFDFFLRQNRKSVLIPVFFVGGVILALWGVVEIFGSSMSIISLENLSIAKRNLVFPTFMYVLGLTFIVALYFVHHRLGKLFLIIAIILLTSADLVRFATKFLPFTSSEYFFPTTKSLAFLSSNIGVFRTMATSDEILPPNFSVMYRLPSISGYDPLYIARYAELIAASERGKPDIRPPFGFNRIIAPKRYDSEIVNMLGVKYILSFDDLPRARYRKVFEEGRTKIYENSHVFPRAFLVKDISYVVSKNQVIEKFFDGTKLQDHAFTDDPAFREFVKSKKMTITGGDVSITSYSENTIIIRTVVSGEGFLILTDPYYPTWKAKLVRQDGTEENLQVFRTNYLFRGIFVPKGENVIKFYSSLF